MLAGGGDAGSSCSKAHHGTPVVFEPNAGGALLVPREPSHHGAGGVEAASATLSRPAIPETEGGGGRVGGGTRSSGQYCKNHGGGSGDGGCGGEGGEGGEGGDGGGKGSTGDDSSDDDVDGNSKRAELHAACNVMLHVAPAPSQSQQEHDC